MPMLSDTRICSSGERQFKDEKLENLFGGRLSVCFEVDTKLNGERQMVK